MITAIIVFSITWFPVGFIAMEIKLILWYGHLITPGRKHKINFKKMGKRKFITIFLFWPSQTMDYVNEGIIKERPSQTIPIVPIRLDYSYETRDLMNYFIINDSNSVFKIDELIDSWRSTIFIDGWFNVLFYFIDGVRACIKLAVILPIAIKKQFRQNDLKKNPSLS
jgi:hypothetical protein